MNYSSPELQRKLAGEYVLGTLQGGARRRFEQLLVNDRALQQEVQAWERKLSPWLYAVPPEPVPERVWIRIQERLGQRPAAVRRDFWRWLGIGSTAVAAALALLLVLKPATVAPPPLPPATDVAVLGTDTAGPHWIVRRRGDALLELSELKHEAVPAGRDLELWAIPAGGAPQSLGVLHRTGETRAEVALNAEGRARLAAGQLLAISLEPRGGSPTGSPTGPVLFTGKLQG